MVAGYAKFWTCMMTDEWFCGLSCSERGFWMQLILIAKAWGDTGLITTRSRSSLGVTLGLDGKIAGKYLAKMTDEGKIRVRESKGKFLTVEIVKYSYWQGLRAQKGGNNPITDGDFDGKIPAIPEQSRAEQSKAEGDSRPPIDRLNEFLKTEREYITEQVRILKDPRFTGKADGGETLKWVLWQTAKMRAWVLANPQKGNKKNWKSFVSKWLAKSIEEKPEAGWRPDFAQAAADERAAELEKIKRRGDEGGLIPIATILEKSGLGGMVKK